MCFGLIGWREEESDDAGVLAVWCIEVYTCAVTGDDDVGLGEVVETGVWNGEAIGEAGVHDAFTL